MTELEHFIKREDVSTFGRVCGIARTIKTKDEDYCENHNCGECDFYKNKEEIMKILLSQHKEKPKLTYDEKAILRNIDPIYEYIVRNKYGDLIVYVDKPCKGENQWNSITDIRLFSIFNHLFQFIKWKDKEPWFIPDLLED